MYTARIAEIGAEKKPDELKIMDKIVLMLLQDIIDET